MKIIKAYKRELDPNNRIRTLLFKNAGASRFAYNWSLSRRIERFELQEGKEKFTNSRKELKDLVKIKRQEFPWMLEVSSRSIESAIRDLDKAFSNFWKKYNKDVGFPKFKKKGISKDSFRLYGTIKPDHRYIQLPKLGKIRLKEKFPKFLGRITSATISRVSNRWYVSLLVEEEIQNPKSIVSEKVGIDLGINIFATISDGTKVISPKPLKHLENKLKKTQKSLSRKEKGSKNRKKAALKVSNIHRKITNIRSDFLHKLTTLLTKTKSTIIVEDLNVKGMVRNKNLSKPISDQGWGIFLNMLEYKTKWYGSDLIKVDRWFASSKICSSCGFKNDKLKLSDRRWICPKCGINLDRDLNAAKNLEQYKQSHECQGTIKPVEIPMTAELSLLKSTSYVSVKQEASISENYRNFVNDG